MMMMMTTAIIVVVMGREECEHFAAQGTAYEYGLPYVEGGAETVSNVQAYGDGDGKTDDWTAGIQDNDRIRLHNTVLSNFHLALSSLAETTGPKAECDAGREVILISHPLAYFHLSFLHITPWAKL
jgi:hypothetical protein